MYENSFSHSAVALGFLFPILVLVSVWSIIWKALALWKAARQGSKGWYVALLLINTVGILEILYLYVFSKSTSAEKM